MTPHEQAWSLAATGTKRLRTGVDDVGLLSTLVTQSAAPSPRSPTLAVKSRAASNSTLATPDHFVGSSQMCAIAFVSRARTLKPRRHRPEALGNQSASDGYCSTGDNWNQKVDCEEAVHCSKSSESLLILTTVHHLQRLAYYSSSRKSWW